MRRRAPRSRAVILETVSHTTVAPRTSEGGTSQVTGPAFGMDAAGGLHGRGGTAAARRNVDHRGAALGGSRPPRQGQQHLGRAERLLRRLRACAPPGRRARGPVRRPPAGTERFGCVRGRRAGRGAGPELRRAAHRPRHPGSRGGPGQPGGAGGRGIGLPARAARERPRDLGGKRRHVQPGRATARRAADRRLRLACQLVGASASHRGRRGRHRPAAPSDREWPRTMAGTRRSTGSCWPRR